MRKFTIFCFMLYYLSMDGFLSAKEQDMDVPQRMKILQGEKKKGQMERKRLLRMIDLAESFADLRLAYDLLALQDDKMCSIEKEMEKLEQSME